MELSRRLSTIFLKADGRRPVFGDGARVPDGPNWQDNVLFYEYFHGDSGRGVGASHQTGWTALIAAVLDVMALDRAGHPFNPRIRGYQPDEAVPV
jgi:hypothetical protein